MLEQRLRSQRERLGELLGKRPKARVLLEASTESEWVAALPLPGWLKAGVAPLSGLMLHLNAQMALL